MYEYTSRVRYSEIGPDCRMTPLAVVGRMQDCSVFHSQSIGRGPDVWLNEAGAWMILSWQIRFSRLPLFGNEVTTQTRAYCFRGPRGYRNFTLREQIPGEGEKLCAVANSEWIYFDRVKQRPMLVPEVESSGYGTDEKLEMDYKPRRIELPEEEPERRKSIEITETDIDTNRHVNNLKYIEKAAAYLPEDAFVEELRVEYLRQAHLGDLLHPCIFRNEKQLVVALMNGENEPCAIVEFSIA